MKTKKFTFCAALIIFAAQVPAVARAQDSAAAAANDRLTVSRKNGAINIERGNVRRVYRMMKKGRSRGKSAMIGVAVGGGAGAGTGAILYGQDPDDTYVSVIPVFAIIGAGIGAGIGAIFRANPSGF